MKEKIAIVFIILSLFLFDQSWAGTTGKLAGKITDGESGEPLPGVNIIITSIWMDGIEVDIENKMGGVTDEDGNYFILNIPAGIYTVEMRLMGYNNLVFTQVDVSPDLTRTLSGELSEKALNVTGTIDVVAERELIRKDITASQTVNDAQQISSMPVNSIDDVLSTNTGAVFTSVTADGVEDEGIHLRGGRGGEILYLVDGIDVTNNYNGANGMDVSTDAISSMSMMTGGFNAEYGRAMSGVVNITTKEGTEDYHGKVSYDTDKLGEDSEHVWNEHNVKTFLSGPLPLLKRIKFTANYDMLHSNTYMNISENKKTDRTHDFGLFDKNHRFSFSLSANLFSNFKLKASYMGQRRFLKEYDDSYKPIHKDYKGEDEITSDLFYFTFTHMLTNSTFYEFKVSHYEMEDLYYNKYKDPKDYQYFKDSPYFVAPAEDMFDDWNSNYEFFAWKVDTFFYQKYDTTWKDEEKKDSILGIDSSDIQDSINYVDTCYHAENRWIKNQFKKTSVKMDFSSQINRFNLLKAGIEFIQYDIKYKDISNLFVNVSGGSSAVDPNQIDDRSLHSSYINYEYEPLDFSAYIQDKLEYEDMVMNFGLRYEYRDSKGFYFPDDMKTDAAGKENWKKAKGKGYFAPRLAFSFPVTDKAVLRFSYGVFYQFPEWRRYYQNHIYKDGDDTPQSLIGIGNLWDPKTGNGDLDPQKTTNYEVGFDLVLTRDLVLGVVAYYKDIYDLISTKHITTTPYNYTKIHNADYGNSKGLEVNLTQRWGSFFSGKVSYTLSRAEGNAATYNRAFWIAYQESVLGLIPAKNNTTMYWDQPHTLSVDLNFYQARNWNVNMLFTFGSGLPFTLTDARGAPIGEVYSNRKPWIGSLDLRAYKDFRMGKSILRFYVYGTNILDKENVYTVYSDTGLPDETISNTASLESKHNPHWYGPRRNIKLGLSFIF